MPHLEFFERILLFGLQTAHKTLVSTGLPVLLLDADALVLRPKCFDEWLSFEEDIVAQAGGCPLCTPHACEILGSAFNTGAILFKPRSSIFLDQVVAKYNYWNAHNRTGKLFLKTCYNQELFNEVLLRHNPRWLTFPDVLALDMRNVQTGGVLQYALMDGGVLHINQSLAPRNASVTLRMLPFVRWPVGLDSTAYVQKRPRWFPTPGSEGLTHVYKKRIPRLGPSQGVPLMMHNGTCILHAAGGPKDLSPWVERGLWMLPLPNGTFACASLQMAEGGSCARYNGKQSECVERYTGQHHMLCEFNLTSSKCAMGSHSCIAKRRVF